jgi:transcriptional regulator with XRE-family HTH domain
MASSSSSSPLAKLYASDDFRLAWDNEIEFHVAQNAIHLRRLREMSQKEVAAAMGTSQSKIARLEGADDNITVRTLKRLAKALKGRIRFSLEPSEAQVPRWPAWWETIGTPAASECEWQFKGFVSRQVGEQQQLVGGWATNPEAPKIELHQKFSLIAAEDDAA